MKQIFYSLLFLFAVQATMIQAMNIDRDDSDSGRSPRLVSTPGGSIRRPRSAPPRRTALAPDPWPGSSSCGGTHSSYTSDEEDDNNNTPAPIADTDANGVYDMGVVAQLEAQAATTTTTQPQPTRGFLSHLTRPDAHHHKGKGKLRRRKSHRTAQPTPVTVDQAGSAAGVQESRSLDELLQERVVDMTGGEWMQLNQQLLGDQQLTQTTAQRLIRIMQMLTARANAEARMTNTNLLAQLQAHESQILAQMQACASRHQGFIEQVLGDLQQRIIVTDRDMQQINQLVLHLQRLEVTKLNADLIGTQAFGELRQQTTNSVQALTRSVQRLTRQVNAQTRLVARDQATTNQTLARLQAAQDTRTFRERMINHASKAVNVAAAVILLWNIYNVASSYITG